MSIYEVTRPGYLIDQTVITTVLLYSLGYSEDRNIIQSTLHFYTQQRKCSAGLRERGGVDKERFVFWVKSVCAPAKQGQGLQNYAENRERRIKTFSTFAKI